MPIPAEYFHATRVFESFMVDARDAAELTTTNMAWNMVVGVFQAFRRRLDVDDAVRFASALPAGLRHLFVADWDPLEVRRIRFDPADILNEVRAVRAAHNFSPPHAQQAVAAALWKHVDQERLERTLRSISADALDFWKVAPAEATDVTRREALTISHIDDVVRRPDFDSN